MVLWRIHIVLATWCAVTAVHYPQTSDVSEEQVKDSSQQRDPEKDNVELDKSEPEKVDAKSVLQEALNTVLNSESVVHRNEDDNIKVLMNAIALDNQSVEQFFYNMDSLSEDTCKRTQDTFWAYVNDLSNESKRKLMLIAARQEEEVKWGYWNILKSKYLERVSASEDPFVHRKLKILKERGVNVPNPNSYERTTILNMQRIWNDALVCGYNTTCGQTDIKTYGDIISIFKSSRNNKELLYYWKLFRDATGWKIKPFFDDYLKGMNILARAENFSDVGEIWRFSFDDPEFKVTVKKLWTEVKPLYKQLADYVREKLRSVYNESVNNTLPAHLLGNIWGQEWQSIYNIVAPYSDKKLLSGVRISSRSLFDDVDEFYQSMGFQSLEDAYIDVDDFQKTNTDCTPSSHDMCDGVTFRIKWCARSEPAVKALVRAATLLGQVQYYSHYSHLPVYFRNGPTPAFKIAFPNLIATQMSSPDRLKKLKLLPAPLAPELYLNHLMWLALEKIPLIAYSYILDTWRWDVFEGERKWNRHWWNLRLNETGVSPSVARDDNDLDPAAKYHVVSHMPYITYLVSEILEFQILRSLCKTANQTGPLHKCSLYGSKEAGLLLSKGMRLGARKDWRTVLKTMTGETEISTAGILEYFKPLRDFLEEENMKLTRQTSKFTITIVSVLGLAFLAILVLVVYMMRKNSLVQKIVSALGISQNGSLDIATTTEMSSREDNGLGDEKL